jgi:iron-sulfur cluster assembly protein
MIQLSPTAIAEINRLQAKSHESGSILRLSVAAGGCMDWHYALSFCHASTSEDHLLQWETVQIAVDKASFERIGELVIDYSEDLMGGGFRFKNPKAVQVCGCGTSFSMDLEEA